MIEVALAPADAARSRLLRLFGARARALFVRREVRVAWVGTLLVASAFAAIGIAPVWVLALGPLVWGVPHVLADLRYLVVRPGLHRRAALAAAGAGGIALGWAGAGLAGALAGAAAVAALARGSLARRAAVAAPLVLLALVARAAPRESTLVFAHLHNAIALAFFVAWRRGSRLALVPVVAAALGAALVLGGALDGALAAARPLGGVALGDMQGELAPFDLVAPLSRDPMLPGRLVLLFAFGQSVHYVAWLRLVPEEDRPSPTPRSFRQSFRALRADLGRVLLGAAAVTAIVLAAWAFVDLGEARHRYLQLAFFHGWLEIAAAAAFLVEGRPVAR